MRLVLAGLAVAGVVAPSVASGQDVIIRQPAERGIVVREPAERRVIVRETEERVIVRRAPQTVRTDVFEERRPSIAYERRVVVGDTLPDTVKTYETPDSGYGYVVLNERRYIVDDDRRIVDVVD